REVPAVRVDGQRAGPEPDVAVGDERTALADRAEPVVLELHENHRREVVVQLRDVDVVGGHPGHLVQPLRDGTVTGRREVLVVHVHPRDRLTPPTVPTVRARADEDGWPPEVARALDG